MNKLGEAAVDRELKVLCFIGKNSEDGDSTYEELQHFALKSFGVRFLDSVLIDLVRYKFIGSGLCEETYHITNLGKNEIMKWRGADWTG